MTFLVWGCPKDITKIEIRYSKSIGLIFKNKIVKRKKAMLKNLQKAAAFPRFKVSNALKQSSENFPAAVYVS